MTAWGRARLGECCEIVSGATPSTSVQDYWDGEIWWATPRDLSDLEGPRIATTARRITAAGLAACAASVLPAGSVLFSSRAPIGHVAINTVPMVTNQGFKSFIPKADVLHAPFLFWWLRANRAYLESLGNGATFKEVSKAIVAGVEIPVPPLSEQRRLAEILDRAEALRAKRRAALAQIDGLTQAIFLEAFGDPATNPRLFPLESLGSLLKVKSGEFLPASSMASGGSYPVLGGNGINGYHDQFLFEREQIVIGRVGVYCGCVHVSPPRSWITDNALYVAEHSERLDFDYLAFALSLARLNQYASQSGQPLVSGSRIYPVRILVPPLNLQRSFARRAAAVDNLKAAHRASLAQLDALFASLQHRAFRGEL